MGRSQSSNNGAGPTTTKVWELNKAPVLGSSLPSFFFLPFPPCPALPKSLSPSPDPSPSKITLMVGRNWHWDKLTETTEQAL